MPPWASTPRESAWTSLHWATTGASNQYILSPGQSLVLSLILVTPDVQLCDDIDYAQCLIGG
jgi:hypothetical protein